MVILDTRTEAEKGVGDILIVLAAKLRNYVILQSGHLSSALGKVLVMKMEVFSNTNMASHQASITNCPLYLQASLSMKPS